MSSGCSSGERPSFSCETVLIFSLNQELKALFVNETPHVIRLRVHFLVSTTHRQSVRYFMWLPSPIYERIPQFWFLLGLLFTVTGLYLGFEFSLAFGYVAIGFCSCGFGAGIYLVRLRHRQSLQAVAQTPTPENPAEPSPAEPEPAESTHTE